MIEMRRERETADLAEDARQLLNELDGQVSGVASATGECRPALDVVDTAAAVEVVVDVPGVPAHAIRVLVRRNTVLVVGAKIGSGMPAESRYHVAERSHGRFARAVRLTGAVDASRAKAIVRGGLLRVILPRIDDRRGQPIRVAVESA
ncbi:MAG: Hsp20 family protein [Acidimicrobiia bacterium]|nr:Hsp20 family protein [Acidimicrobiia bacterium]